MATIDGIKTHYITGGHGPYLLLLHGYAAMYRSEVTKLALMDAFVPGIGDWRTIYNDPAPWHFRFVGPTPEALVRGRERIYFEHFWNDFAADSTHSIPESDRVAYAKEYAEPGKMRAGFAYFGAFNLSAKDFEILARNKLTIPLLAIGGDQSLGAALTAQAPLISTKAKTIILKNKGHWILEEAPKETMDALLAFL